MIGTLQTLFALVGGIAGIWALYDRFRNRRPDLKGFAPYYWTARHPISKAPLLCVFFRLSNYSRVDAFLYLETSRFSVYDGRKWVKMTRCDVPVGTKLSTDFSDDMKVRFGIDDVQVLSQHSECSIKFDRPLCGLLVFTHPNMDLLRDAPKMKLQVFDCHFCRHVFEIDVAEQKRRFDPDSPGYDE